MQDSPKRMSPAGWVALISFLLPVLTFAVLQLWLHSLHDSVPQGALALAAMILVPVAIICGLVFLVSVLALVVGHLRR